MVYMDIAVCATSRIHTLCGQNTAYLNATPGGRYSNHYAERVNCLQHCILMQTVVLFFCVIYIRKYALHSFVCISAVTFNNQ